jgi:hypothetical protein
MLLALASPAASRADTGDRFFYAFEYELPDEQGDYSALRDLMESVMDLYAPALKARILSLEKKLATMTRFSGSIYLEGEKALSPPKISGEAAVSNEGDDLAQPLVNWSVKTSLDFDSGGVGVELWKETGFARISFSSEVEQDFSQEFEYRSLLKLEKKF